MRPIDGSPRELQQFIAAGELLRPGDVIRIVTVDDKVHRFAIVRLEPGMIVGRNESIVVAEITSLQVQQPKPVSLPFDAKGAIDYLALVAFSFLRPSTVDATTH
jgi:hypothetical protein